LIIHLRNLKTSLNQFMLVRPLKEPDTMHLSEVAIRDLELFETSHRRQLDGSLFKEVNQTLTPMGARLLRYNLSHPLMNRQMIAGRHAAVKGLLRLGEEALVAAREQLKHAPDLE